MKIVAFIVVLFAIGTGFVSGDSTEKFVFGGDLITTPREKARYSTDSSIVDFGLPFEGVYPNGINDRIDTARPDNDSFLQFPYGSLTDPTTYRLVEFSATTLVLDETFPGLESLFEVSVIDNGLRDVVEFKSGVPSGRSRSEFRLWIWPTVLRSLNSRWVFESDSSLEIEGLEVEGLGDLHWIVLESGGKWYVSKSKITEANPILTFLSDDSDGEWAEIDDPTVDILSSPLNFEEVDFKNVFRIGIGTFGGDFIEANQSRLSFEVIRGNLATFRPEQVLGRADLRFWLPGSGMRGDNVYNLSGGKKTNLRIKKRGRIRFNVENDGNFNFRKRVQTFGPPKRKFRTRILDRSRRNVTASAKIGLETSLLAPGASEDFDVTFRARSRYPRRKLEFRFRVRAAVIVPESDFPSDYSYVLRQEYVGDSISVVLVQRRRRR